MSAKLTKKPGLMSRLFSQTSISGNDRPETEKKKNKQRLQQRLHSVDVTAFRDKNSSGLFEDSLSVSGGMAPTKSKSIKDAGKGNRKQSVPVTICTVQTKKPETYLKPTGSQPKAGCSSGSSQKKLKHRKKDGDASGIKVNTSKPLEFPATPEMIYEYHKRKPFLNKNEEWLVMELNEYECLVDSLQVIQIIAKHSKFFEVEPDELWEEFFEFMEDVPSYDEMINYDVWQEFRDNKYPC